MQLAGLVALLTLAFGVVSIPASNPHHGVQLPQNAGAIVGTVVDGSTGAAVADAFVSVGIGNAQVSGEASRQLTDGSGRFAFLGLSPSRGYVVSAAKFGYFDGAYGSQPTIPRVKATLVVSAGTVQKIQIVLWRGGSVAGTVRDEGGEFVAGTVVRLLREQFVTGRRRWVARDRVLTTDNGGYRFSGLTPGRYVVMVPSVQVSVPGRLEPMSDLPPSGIAALDQVSRDIGDRPALAVGEDTRLVLGPYPLPPSSTGSQIYTPTFFPGATHIEDAGIITVDYADFREGIDVQLSTSSSVRVQGELQVPEGRTLAGLTVCLMPVTLDYLGIESAVATTVLEEHGRFRFPRVPPGTYRFVARRATTELADPDDASGDQARAAAVPAFLQYGIASRMIGSVYGTALVIRNLYGTDDLWAWQEVVVEEKPIDDLVVQANRAASVSGEIVWSKTKAATEIKPRALMAFDPADGNVTRAVQVARFQITGTRHTFRFDGLLFGPYLPTLEGVAGWVIKSIVRNGTDYTSRPLEIDPGADLTDVTITMADNPAAIEGKVEDARGQAVARAAVILFPTDQTLWSNYGFTPARIRSVLVDAGGAFHLMSLPAGSYHIVAVRMSSFLAWQDPDFLQRAASRAPRVTLEWGGTAVQNLILTDLR